MDDVIADLRFALRAMRRAPGFAAAAILSLALGVGTSIAIYGAADALLFQPLPVRDPGRLVHVTTAGTSGDATSGSSNTPWADQVAARTDLFSDVMLVRHDRYKVALNGAIEPITGQRVTTNYFDLLGVRPILGRTLQESDAPEKGREGVVVISYGLWQRAFGGDASVLGRALTIDQRPYSIVGVTPPEFHGILVGWTMDVTMPLDRSAFMDTSLWYTMPLMARLRPGVERARVNAELSPLLRRFVADSKTPERYQRRYLGRISAEPAARGISDLRPEFAKPVRLLLFAVTALLLIACVNLAGLLVARNATRQHELGMRLALGAGRVRLVRQMLTESALLAVIGVALGLPLAIYGGNFLLGLLPSHDFGPLSLAIAINGRLLVLTVVAMVATTLGFGLLPAWQAARLALLPSVNRANPRFAPTRPRLGRVLVVAQCATALVLMTGSALLVRSLINLWSVDTGFDRQHVLIARLDPQGTVYERARLREFQREMLDGLGRLPGVQQVSLTTGAPFSGNNNTWRLVVPGFDAREPDDNTIQVTLVGPRYFDALQVPILAGRDIDERDVANGHRVAVVAESFARRYFGSASAAIGRTFVTNRGPADQTHEVVGVAMDLRYQDLRTASERTVYLPWFQATEIRSTTFEFVIRTQGDPAQTIVTTRAELRRRYPDAPIESIDTMTDVIGRQLLSERLLAILGSAFGVIAMLLAAIGLYGLLAHLVTRRVTDIGTRIALGARPAQMMWMILRENLVLVLAGSAIGVAIGALTLRSLDAFLFGLSHADATNIVLAIALLVVVSLVAAAIPARRASTVDPLTALRAE